MSYNHTRTTHANIQQDLSFLSAEIFTNTASTCLTISNFVISEDTTVNVLSPYMRWTSLKLAYDSVQNVYEFEFKYINTYGTLQTISHTGLTVAQLETYCETYFETVYQGTTRYGLIIGIGVITLESDLLLDSAFDTYWESVTHNIVTSIEPNYIDFYLLNSDKHTVSKSITWVYTEVLNFTKPITYKTIDLDRMIKEDDVSFNYVFITSLNRYYYVDSITLTNDHQVIHLVEDVLMSFADLIKSQTAFIKRQENANYPNIVDDEVYTNYDKSISEDTITLTNDIFTLYPFTFTDSGGTDHLVMTDSGRPCFVVTVVSAI